MWTRTFTTALFIIYYVHVDGQGPGGQGGFDPRSGGFSGGGGGRPSGGMGFGASGGRSSGGMGFGASGGRPSGGMGFSEPASTPARPGQCPMDRRIDGYVCGGGRGDNVINCPSGSECIADRSIGTPVCCWTETSTVSAPCEDPMMRGSEFVTCSQGGRQCPGSCHTCEVLQGLGSGLCCPQVDRPGCERSSPMRNQFEDSRRRILSMGDTGTPGGGMTSDSGGMTSDTATSMGSMDRFSTGDTSLRVGMDFGMSARRAVSPRRPCPDGSAPISACSRTSPCGDGMNCIAVTRMAGMCCPIPGMTSSFGRGGVRPPIGPGMMGARGMMMSRGMMPGMGMTGGPGGFPGGFQPGGPGGFGGARPPFMGRRF